MLGTHEGEIKKKNRKKDINAHTFSASTGPFFTSTTTIHTSRTAVYFPGSIASVLSIPLFVGLFFFLFFFVGNVPFFSSHSPSPSPPPKKKLHQANLCLSCPTTSSEKKKKRSQYLCVGGSLYSSDHGTSFCSLLSSNIVVCFMCVCVCVGVCVFMFVHYSLLSSETCFLLHMKI